MTESTKKTETSGLAIFSLIVGIILGPLGSIPAIITGHLALGKIKRSSGQLTGKGLAIAGLSLGYLGLVVTVAGVSLIAVLSNQADRTRKEISSIVSTLDDESSELEPRQDGSAPDGTGQ